MSKTTIENSKNGYTLRCTCCAGTYELETVRRGLPLWAFKSLAAGFEEEHSNCKEASVPFTQVSGELCIQCGKSPRHCQCASGVRPINRSGTRCPSCNDPNFAEACGNCSRNDCLYCVICCKKTEARNG